MTSVLAWADRVATRAFTRPSITWQQSVSIVVPLIAENLFTTLFSMLNAGLISSSGVTALSAVSLVDTLNNFLFVFYTGIATGASVIVANYRGRGEEKRLHDACVQAVTSVTLFTILTMVFMLVFQQPLLQLLFGAVEAAVMEQAVLYMLGCAVSLPLLGVTTAVCGVLRGIGEGKTSLGYTIVSTLIYVGLSVVFIRVMKMGIMGLILAITLSRLINLPLLLRMMNRSHSQFRFQIQEFFHIDLHMFRGIMRVGFPCAIESLFFTGGRLVTQTIIVPMGTNAIAAYNIAYSIMQLNQVFVTPLNTAMFTICGICMGHDRPEDVRSLTKSYFVLDTGIYVVSLGLVLLFFDALAQFYSAPQEIVRLIYHCTLITGIANPILHNFGFMIPSVFRAVGDGKFCTVISLITMWVFRVLGGYVLGVVFGMGVMGVWLGMILDWIVRAIVYPIRFRGDRWLRHKVVEE